MPCDLWDLSSPNKDGTHIHPQGSGLTENFDVMINGVVSLISPSYSSLPEFRNVTGFCILILYHA